MNPIDQIPTLSVIVPTYQGANKILTPLSSLARQRFTDFEVIVVIDGSTDNTKQVIADAKLSLNIRVHQQINGGRAGSRNAGAALAKAKHLIFFDDDVEIPEHVVQEYARMIGKNSVVVGAFYPVYKIQSEFSRYASYLNDQWISDLPVQGIMDSPYLSAANFFIERDVFDSVGGFNRNLTDAEDFDLAVRLFDIGVPIYFCAEIKVGHVIQETFREHASRLMQYKIAQEKLFLENPTVAKYKARILRVSGIKALIYRFFSFPIYLTMIDSGVFKILPRRVRFRLYSLILTAYPTYHTS